MHEWKDISVPGYALKYLLRRSEWLNSEQWAQKREKTIKERKITHYSASDNRNASSNFINSSSKAINFEVSMRLLTTHK